MTTSDVTANDPYNNGDIIAVNKPRSLDELLKLDTYQGMSDDEIRLIIAYKEYRAMKDAEISAALDTAREEQELFREKWADIKSATMDSFKQACAFVPEFQGVNHE